MRFAYADPPYLGCAAKRYGDPTYDSIGAHQNLIQKLGQEFPDGWAYSLNSTTLADILPLCPKGIRVMAWVKPFASFKPGVNPAYAWEPILIKGGRRRGRDLPTIRDWVSVNITLKKGLCGAKPPSFVLWLLQVLNVQAEDEFVDMFPGTGIVSSTWQEYRKEIR